MRIAFLTPNLPPRVCGLADHSRLLGSALAARGCEVGVIGRHGDTSEPLEACSDRSSVWDGTPSGLAGLLSSFRPDWLLVQLSGYGYSRWGAPWMLARSLGAVRREFSGVSIAVFVHELHCQPRQLGIKGPLLAPWQRAAIRRVLRLADVVFPTTPLYLQECVDTYGVRPDKMHLLAIAANVPRLGQSEETREVWRRKLGISSVAVVAVTFGRWNSQRMALERLGPVISRGFADGSLDRVVAVGGETSDRPSWVLTLLGEPSWSGRLLVLGPQAPERISGVLAAANVGLVPTPWSHWEKSGAARAFEQAGLTLWIFDEEQGGCRVRQASPNLPTWEGIAERLLEKLSSGRRRLKASCA